MKIYRAGSASLPPHLLNGIIFEDCSIRNAHMKDASFDGADLRGADISGIKLENARMFKGAIISNRQAAELMLGLGLLVA